MSNQAPLNAGFFKIFFVMLIVVVLGAAGWLAIADMPVQQSEIVVDIPVDQGL